MTGHGSRSRTTARPRGSWRVDARRRGDATHPTAPQAHDVRAVAVPTRTDNVECNMCHVPPNGAPKIRHRVTSRTQLRLPTVACPPHHSQAVTQAKLFGRLLGPLFVEPLDIMLLVSAPRHFNHVATRSSSFAGRCPSRMPLVVAIRIHVHT